MGPRHPQCPTGHRPVEPRIHSHRNRQGRRTDLQGRHPHLMDSQRRPRPHRRLWGFLNADSVKTNPFWSWDSVMPGFISGGSIRASANGTQQVMRSEPFPVFPGQTLELRAASQWTGAVATAGSNPVKVGFTLFDAEGNPLADVIRGSLQPSGDHSWQWVPVQDKWPVPWCGARVRAVDPG